LTAAATGLALIRSCGARPFAFGHAQALAHGALDTHQSDAEDVFGHFADRTHPAVAEVVDIIDRAVAVADIDQHLEHGQDVVLVEHARTGDFLATDAAVEFHPAQPTGRSVPR
jgi:hypothetical protein